MPRECAAAGCCELATAESPFSFHRFPKDPHRKKEWAIKVNRKGPTGKLWMPKDHDVICSKHFVYGDFTPRTHLSGKDGFPQFVPELTDDAVPSVFDHNEGKRKRQQESAARRSSLTNKRRRREVVDCAMAVPSEPETDSCKQEAADDIGSADQEEIPSQAQDTRNIAIQVVVHPKTVSTKQQTVRVKTASKQTETSPQLNFCQSTQMLEKTCTSVGCQTDPICQILKDEEESSELGQEENEGEVDEEEKNSDWQEGMQEIRQTHTEDLNITDPFADRKYIVCETQLEVLFSVCRACAKPCQVVKKEECGTSVKYTSECECGHIFTWMSQPFSRQLPLVNLVLAAATFFTACSPARLLDAFRYSNIACFSRQTYNNIQGAYLVPAVRQVWQKCQDELFLARRGRTVKLTGDGQCDSPGHCAKYCSYSLMDAETAEILHVELVQSNQVRNSHAMELQGLQKALHKMKHKMSISHLITDRHASIKKYMRDHHSQEDEEQFITHRFDVWHMAKGVEKKLDAAAKSKRNAGIGLWVKGIKKHMYWCSTSTPEGPSQQQVVKDKWISIANHIADIHDGHGGTFQRCLHGALEPRVWIRKGTRQHRTLEGIICSKFLLKDIGMLSPDVQTSSLESYHSVVCHFAPKLCHFTYQVMESKMLLAAMHFNANAGRKQAVTEEGDLQWKISRPRSAKGAAVPKPVKEKQTRNYISDLFEAVTLLRLTYTSYRRAKEAQQEYNQSVPPPLSQTAPQIDKATVVAQHRARMNWATAQRPDQSD